ncbi:MAG: hypothetical protein R2857_15010 [Vampirovibrionales bacterium]
MSPPAPAPSSTTSGATFDYTMAPPASGDSYDATMNISTIIGDGSYTMEYRPILRQAHHRRPRRHHQQRLLPRLLHLTN